MELQRLLTALQNHHLKAICQSASLAHIETQRLIKPGQTSFFRGCIYIGHVSDLPQTVASDTACSLLCVDDAPIPHCFLQLVEANIYLVGSDASPLDILEQISDIMMDEILVVSAMERIHDALYSNNGLQYIVDVASEIFLNPVFINDTAYKLLAMSHQMAFSDEILESQKHLGYVHEDNVKAMRRTNDLMKDAAHSDKVIYNIRQDKDERWMFKSVRLNGITVAIIAIVDDNRPFRSFDENLLERFSHVVALELEKDSFYKENAGIMYNYFIADMLAGKLLDQKTFIRRSRAINWKTYEWFQLIVISHSSNDHLEEKLQRLGMEIRTLIPDCWWASFNNDLVLLISRPDKKIFSDAERQTLTSFIEYNQLFAGICEPFKKLVDTPRYYEQALHAVDTGAFVRKRPGIYTYSDMMIYYLARIVSAHGNLSDFSHPAIAVLQAYDKANGSNMIDTLDQYLRYSGDSIAAAKALNIHRNTFLYRVNKIRELTGVNLSDGDERLRLHLCLRFLEYR